MLINKQVKLDLVGVNGNAYSVMGAFSNAAKKEGWSKEEIKTVLDEAMSGDYNHLLGTILEYCRTDDEDEDEET